MSMYKAEQNSDYYDENYYIPRKTCKAHTCTCM